MKNIAIFISGAGESAERIIKLFNEGNRLRTVLVVTNDNEEEWSARLKDKDIELLYIPDSQWHAKELQVAETLKDKEVDLIVLDGFNLSLSDEILEATNGEMIRVSSSDLAPREVVAALEKDLRRPVEEEVVEPAPDENPSPESEWADALKIQFTPPKVPQTPPAVEEIKEEIREEKPLFENNRQFEPNRREWKPNYSNFNKHHHSEEPMPSTWLIWSILVAVFCCFIPGIIAIIFSSQVSGKYYSGDIEGAKQASRNAEIWIIVSFVLGVLAATLYIPFMLISW